jgi:hypothetical protein
MAFYTHKIHKNCIFKLKNMLKGFKKLIFQTFHSFISLKYFDVANTLAYFKVWSINNKKWMKPARNSLLM